MTTQSKPQTSWDFRWRIALLLGLAIAATAVAFSVPRFTDPAWVYNLADHREMLGIPNFMDVVSSAPWAAIGFLGLLFVWRSKETGANTPFTEAWERSACVVLFSALGLVAFGSVYFHLAPSPGTLLWDRLPITIIFMSFLALTIGERIGMRAGRLLFWPLLTLGLASVLHWRYTEAMGRGDVRWYLLVQFFPILAIPIMLLLFRARYTRTSGLVIVLGLYALAKVFELYDARVLELTKIFSGHTLKHLTGALAALWMLRTIRLRRQTSPPPA